MSVLFYMKPYSILGIWGALLPLFCSPGFWRPGQQPGGRTSQSQATHHVLYILKWSIARKSLPDIKV